MVAQPNAFETARTYFALGVEHIMLGFDHLLFVLALLLLIRNTRSLLLAITAFTAAHSVTLAFSALGLASAPQAPIEALIALSIMFVACEIVGGKWGNLSTRYPWLVSFLFGLLHGFGFGGALRDIGLPQKDVPPALLTFNLGVEQGSLSLSGSFCWWWLASACFWHSTFSGYGHGWPTSSVWFPRSGLSSVWRGSVKRGKFQIVARRSSLCGTGRR